jgi:hypothetical protein
MEESSKYIEQVDTRTVKNSYVTFLAQKFQINPLKINCMCYIRTQHVLHSKHFPTHLYNTSLLMLSKAEVIVHPEIHTQHTNIT